ncbi:MAG TPA: GlsB/YeaQ/YmgE family stress response membrane protein, partial [Rugosimonospora sp.]|nr:GlsB/YeaQ/YmgE family stress response membrane protein [Rugosimonospora sp.]
MVAGTTLERRYRRLLWSYPGGYRAARADELVGTLLDLAAPGRRWPTVPEAVDLALGGLRERLRRPLVAGAEAGLAIAAPVALGLAGALALFCALVVEPAPAGYASFGGYRTVGPVAYAA